jgi:hypothetical protein
MHDINRSQFIGSDSLADDLIRPGSAIEVPLPVLFHQRDWQGPGIFANLKHEIIRPTGDELMSHFESLQKRFA